MGHLPQHQCLVRKLFIPFQEQRTLFWTCLGTPIKNSSYRMETLFLRAKETDVSDRPDKTV
jgi:hypothetical protein